MADGTTVGDRDAWVNQRRPSCAPCSSITCMAPSRPNPPDRLHVEREDPAYSAAKRPREKSGSRQLDCRAFIFWSSRPTNATRPAPVFLGMNFCGNTCGGEGPAIPLSGAWFYNSCRAGSPTITPPTPAAAPSGSPWSIEQSIDRGFAVATSTAATCADRADLIETGAGRNWAAATAAPSPPGLGAFIARWITW